MLALHGDRLGGDVVEHDKPLAVTLLWRNETWLFGLTRALHNDLVSLASASCEPERRSSG